MSLKKKKECGFCEKGENMRFKKDEIIFLFGAGISADAGIPTSKEMVKEIEKFIKEKEDWQKYRELYYLIKSGYEFSYGIQGKEPHFNIEILVNILQELEKKETHPLYPFIGSWHIKFNEVIANDFNKITEFKKKIIKQLKKWMKPRNLKRSNYLSKIKDFQRELNLPIRIFTLNYDLLLESNLNDVKVERGFDEDRKWNYKRFSELYEEPEIYLYKLHGSIDWERDQNTQIVRFIDTIPEEPDLIFGTQYKMQYTDPYLFMFSELRYYSLNCKLIVCLGYSFSDEHINAILSQALLTNNNLKLYCLAYGEKDELIYEKLLKNNSNISRDRIKIVTDKTAKQFFENEFELKTFKDLFPESEEGIL